MTDWLQRLEEAWSGQGRDLAPIAFLVLVLASALAAFVVAHLYTRFYGRRAAGSDIHRAFPLLGIWLYFLWRYVASRRAIPSTPAPARPRQITWAVAGLGITLAVEAVFLAPAFSRDSMAPLEVLEVLQFLVLIVLTVQTWRGEDWARWGIIVLIVANRLFFV